MNHRDVRSAKIMEKEEKSEKTFWKQHDQFRTIFSVTTDLLILQDNNLVYQAVNPAYCRFMNRNEEDVIGKTHYDLFPQDLANQ